ncbi:hypothetical protein H5410_044546, partial [Solanum commersonii]
VVLKDEPDIDPNDHSSILEHLDKVVANPQDILIFSKSSKKFGKEAKFDDSERLRPEELNPQNIEALVAESNLKMEVLPVSDLDVALHNFVNKDEKMAFYSCVQYNLEETRRQVVLLL